jgi:hypothetical protein
VKVGIEFQVAAEGMWNNHDPHADTKLDFYPLLNHTGAEDRQIVQEMPVSLKNQSRAPAAL